MTGVNTIEYHVHLDNGVRLTLSLPKTRNGPAFQGSFLRNDPMPYSIELPGTIVSIYAPSATVGGINWVNVARALGAGFILPFREPPPPKPKPDPYVQKVIE